MWHVIDRAYAWLFKYGGFALLLLLPVACYYLFGPTHCNFGAERTKLSRVLSDFRQVKIQLAELETTNSVLLSLPLDPFAKEPAPYILLITTNEIIAASVGPDAAFDNKWIQYDPTNGSISAGDVLTTISIGSFLVSSEKTR